MENINEIPKSAIFYGLFGTLLIIFSFTTWFGKDWIRFFLGIIGGGLVGFIGYLVWSGTSKDIKIEELTKDIQAIDSKVNNLETKMIELKENTVR